eukprot:gene25280-30855_t
MRSEPGKGASLADPWERALTFGVINGGGIQDARKRALNLRRFNDQLKALADEGAAEKALALFNRMRSTGTKPDAESFTNLFRSCKKGWRVESALLASIYKCMDSSGVDAGAPVYHELMSCYGRGGHWKPADALLETMLRKKIPLD